MKRRQLSSTIMLNRAQIGFSLFRSGVAESELSDRVQQHARVYREERPMSLRFLGKGGSTNNGCPSLLADDQRGYVVQGWKTGRADTVELPHLLVGFLEPDTFMGAVLTDTGRGTFTLTGEPVTDDETLGQLNIAEDETVIAVPKRERTFYGAASTR